MFEKYIATEKDFEAIEKALGFVWKKELNFIFKDKSKIEKTLVISYDSKQVFVWTKNGGRYSLLKIPHNLKVKDEYQQGWRAALKPWEINSLLPKKWQANWFKLPKISGGLLAPFLKLQKKKKRKLNPYVTYESYLATILHEFAHVYFGQIKPCWHWNKKENLNLLEKAQKIYQGRKAYSKKFELFVPALPSLSELFAFCTEYTAASIFWPRHKENLDKYYSFRISELITKEEKKNLNIQDSVLDENPHDFAATIGIILMKRHGKKWPEIVLRK